LQFDEVLLQLAAEKMNLLMTETFQLSATIDINGLDYPLLLEVILREISNGAIKSIHFTQTEAQRFLKILCSCRTHQENLEKTVILAII